MKYIRRLFPQFYRYWIPAGNYDLGKNGPNSFYIFTWNYLHFLYIKKYRNKKGKWQPISFKELMIEKNILMGKR